MSITGVTKYIAGLVIVLLLMALPRQAESALAGISMTAKPAPVHLVPKPKSLQLKAGSLQLKDSLAISFDNPQLAFSAQQLAQFIKRSGDVQLSDTASVISVLRLDDGLAENAYRLQVDDRGVQITGGSEQAVFYGVQTLGQLIFQYATGGGALRLPYMLVEDYPDFRYRGMHLDVSRHFFDVAFIKRYIDLIALHKMNFFHWHLTDDQGWRIEIAAYPELTEVGATRSSTVVGHTHQADSELDGVEHGGFYTRGDVREIVAYAAQRHITVIPEIDVPGHASAIVAAYPQFGCGPRTQVKTHFGVFKHVLCPTEETFTFLDKVFSQIAELFPGPYIHIGGDEVVKDHWRDSEYCQQLMRRENIANMDQLQAYFVGRVASIVEAHGKQVIAWGDVLKGDISPSVTVMPWLGREGELKAIAAGHEVIMTPFDSVYFDFYQSTSRDEPMAIHGLTRLRDVYGFEPVPAQMSEHMRQKVLGAQANLWTEYIPDGMAVERMVLPRMSALAEVLWSAPQLRSWQDFTARLETFMPFLERLDYQVSKSHYKPEINASLQDDGTFEVVIAVDMGNIHYTLDGLRPDLQSPQYSQPLKLTESATVRARAYHEQQGKWYGDSLLSVVKHKALGAELEFEYAADPKWNEKSEQTIVDGLIGTDRIFRYDDWVRLNGRDLDASLRFSEAIEVGEVSIGFNAGLNRKLHKPTSFSVYGGMANERLRLLGSLSASDIQQTEHRLQLNFTPVLLQTLRVVAGNDGHIWSAEAESMQGKTLFIDEIIVN